MFAGIALCFFMTSCKGQVNNSQNQNAKKETIHFSNFNNQISCVIPAILQDSKGYIGFGTQNGVFKQSGNSLIHIDSIKAESGKGITVEDIAEDKDGIWIKRKDDSN